MSLQSDKIIKCSVYVLVASRKKSYNAMQYMLSVPAFMSHELKVEKWVAP